MSKSLTRVTAALEAAGLDASPVEMPGETRTARQAALEIGCALDQIAKSIVFRAAQSDRVALFITAGGRMVDPARAELVAGEPLEKASADFVRARSGFAIGGVAPLGHLSPPLAFFDPELLRFDTVWPAAGTPRHVFPVDPKILVTLTGASVATFSIAA